MTRFLYTIISIIINFVVARRDLEFSACPNEVENILASLKKTKRSFWKFFLNVDSTKEVRQFREMGIFSMQNKENQGVNKHMNNVRAV